MSGTAADQRARPGAVEFLNLGRAPPALALRRGRRWHTPRRRGPGSELLARRVRQVVVGCPRREPTWCRSPATLIALEPPIIPHPCSPAGCTWRSARTRAMLGKVLVGGIGDVVAASVLRLAHPHNHVVVGSATPGWLALKTMSRNRRACGDLRSLNPLWAFTVFSGSGVDRAHKDLLAIGGEETGPAARVERSKGRRAESEQGRQTGRAPALPAGRTGIDGSSPGSPVSLRIAPRANECVREGPAAMKRSYRPETRMSCLRQTGAGRGARHDARIPSTAWRASDAGKRVIRAARADRGRCVRGHRGRRDLLLNGLRSGCSATSSEVPSTGTWTPCSKRAMRSAPPRSPGAPNR